MKEASQPNPETLGQYLEQGRQDAGLTVRQLATASKVPKSTVNRILKDEVENSSPGHIQQIARVLELDEAEALAFIGVTPPDGLPDIAPYLRAKIGLRGDALHRACEEIQAIIQKHDGKPPGQ